MDNKGIVTINKVLDNLYKKIKLTNQENMKYLKTFNRILRRSISAAKQHFLASTFDKYKSDIKNTWKTIKLSQKR